MIIVRGYSDDILDVAGRISQEFYPDREKPFHLAFSDGTLLDVSYGKGGIWHITPINKGTSFISHEACGCNDDIEYSDVVNMGEDVKWVVGGELVKAKK